MIERIRDRSIVGLYDFVTDYVNSIYSRNPRFHLALKFLFHYQS